MALLPQTGGKSLNVFRRNGISLGSKVRDSYLMVEVKYSGQLPVKSVRKTTTTHYTQPARNIMWRPCQTQLNCSTSHFAVSV